MDLFIRYFKNVTHQVSSRYLRSSFMAHSTTGDIMENLEASNETKMPSLLQVSMGASKCKLVYPSETNFQST